MCSLGSWAARTSLMQKRITALVTLSLALSCGEVAASPLNSVAGTVTVMDRSGGEVGDRSGVVVFLDGASSIANSEAATEVMSHKDRRFSPEVLPVLKGTAIDFFNDDNIYHNVFSLSVPKPFDLGIYPEGTSKVLTFDEPGLVRIYCNLHPEMVSTILVLNNGFFAETDSQGRFEITGIRDGHYTLRLWYEYGEEQSQTVYLSGSVQREENFSVETTKRRRKHKNKFGKPYRQKY